MTQGNDPKFQKYANYSQYSLHDSFCADLLHDLFGRDYRFWVENGCWLRWIGHKWESDICNTIFGNARRRLPESIREIADAYIEPTDQSKGKQVTEQWYKFSRKAGNKASLNAAVEVFKTDGRVQVMTEKLDAKPMQLGCKNGFVMLDTGTFFPYGDPDFEDYERIQYITQSTCIDYDEHADTSDWERTILKICCGDEELAEWLQTAIGYSITGMDTEQVFFLCHGKGSNGKSTFFDLLRKALGDYSMFGEFKTIEEERSGGGEGPRPDLLALFGKRTLFIDEPERPNTTLNEGLVKRMTGGTAIRARNLHEKNYVEFKMTAKIWVAFNREPRIRGSDYGVWRRIRRVPFHAEFSKADEDFDPGIKDRLEKNIASVLKWAVEGAVKWHENGLGWCDAVRESTDQYQRDQDVLADFIQMAILEDDKSYIYTQDLYKTYAEYCQDYKVPPKARIGEKTFNDLLKEKGFGVPKLKGKKRRQAWVGYKCVYLGADMRSLETMQ